MKEAGKKVEEAWKKAEEAWKKAEEEKGILEGICTNISIYVEICRDVYRCIEIYISEKFIYPVVPSQISWVMSAQT